MKRIELTSRNFALIELTLIKISQYSEGQITEDEFKETLKQIDEEHEEIQAELAVLVLLESICLN